MDNTWGDKSVDNTWGDKSVDNTWGDMLVEEGRKHSGCNTGRVNDIIKPPFLHCDCRLLSEHDRTSITNLEQLSLFRGIFCAPC